MARALARRLAANGHPLLLAGRDEAALGREAQDLRIRYGATVSVHPFDASETAKHETWYRELPVRPLWVICAIGWLGSQEEQQRDWAQAEQALHSNFIGVASILHHVANDFEARKEGVIVGISSVAGDRGRASNYYYGSAKAGFTAFLSGLRNRLHAAGVQVLTVKPGFVDTRMTQGLDLPKPLTAQPDEVAAAILRAIAKRKNVVYVRWIWRWIMLAIVHVPEGVFKKMKL